MPIELAVLVLASDIGELGVEEMTVVGEEALVVHVAVEVTTAVAVDDDTATIVTLELCSGQE